jgi:hypothetical protein
VPPVRVNITVIVPVRPFTALVTAVAPNAAPVVGTASDTETVVPFIVMEDMAVGPDPLRCLQ